MDYNMIATGLLGIAYIACSACLIAYNKYLINVERFPYATCIVLLHASFCAVASGILYWVMPSLFTSLTDPTKKVAVDRSLIFKCALPIAFFFTIQLVMSNTAYLHCSVAFVQMVKEGNLVVIYFLSLAVALERFSLRNVCILAAITCATTLTIHGEINFSRVGFCLQITSQFFECNKIVLQAILLTGAGYKLDALSYVLLVMPFCAILLGGTMGVLTFFPSPNFQLPTWHDILQWWPHLLANACLACVLNVMIALFIKRSSAVAFMLAGFVKDAMIVTVAAVVLRESISHMQAFGFSLQLTCIGLWSFVKAYPDRFEDGIAAGFLSFAITKESLHHKAQQYGSTEENPEC
jgi:hypothetical protein